LRPTTWRMQVPGGAARGAFGAAAAPARHRERRGAPSRRRIAQIGIQRSAYFPSLSLSASAGQCGDPRRGICSARPRACGPSVCSVAQTIFDAGATNARVAQAEAGRDAAVARYRQTVLAAIPGPSKTSSARRGSLAEQMELRRTASEAADLTEQQLLNRYKAGQVSYTDVVTAQALGAEARAAHAVRNSRRTGKRRRSR